jgi:hypothetical protein
VKFCPECGSQFTTEMEKFCSNCSYDVNNGVAAPPENDKKTSVHIENKQILDHIVKGATHDVWRMFKSNEWRTFNILIVVYVSFRYF